MFTNIDNNFSDLSSQYGACLQPDNSPSKFPVHVCQSIETLVPIPVTNRPRIDAEDSATPASESHGTYQTHYVTEALVMDHEIYHLTM